MDFLEFLDRFPNEQKVIEYFIKIRYPKGVACNHCGGLRISKRSDNPRFFQCNDCNDSFSIFKDTIFEKSDTDLRKWMYAIHLFLNAKKGISGYQLQREIKVRETASGPEEYIEVTKQDLDLARRIAWPVFKRTLDEMPPHTRTFLERITELRDAESKRLAIEPELVRLTRRSMMQSTGLSSSQVHHHLAKLIELECIVPSSGGVGRLQTYEVLWSGEMESFFDSGEDV